MKKIFLIFMLGISLIGMHAQVDFTVPENYAFVSREDYVTYEGDIINASKWLDQTPLEKETTKRKEVEGFVLTWVSGSSSVTLTLYPKMIDYTEKNNLLITLIAGYSRYVLEHKDSPDGVKAMAAGLTSIMGVYEISTSKKKEPLIEKMIKKKSDLEKFAKDLMKL
jgi:hypothetical protein